MVTTKQIDEKEHRFVAEHVITSGENTKTVNTAQLIFYPPADPTKEQTLRLIEQSGVVDFWDRPEEDGYTKSDGEPL